MFSLVKSKQHPDFIWTFFCCQKNKKSLWKKLINFPRYQKLEFELPTFIKAVIAEIEFKCNKNNNREPIYLV